MLFFSSSSVDFRGEKNVRFKVNLNATYNCALGHDHYPMTVVAHSVVKAVGSDGKLIKSSKQDVYAYEHDVDSDPWFGYFNFMIGCHCPVEEEPVEEEPSEDEEPPKRAPPKTTSKKDSAPPKNTCIVSGDNSGKERFDLIASKAWEPLTGYVEVAMLANDTLQVIYSSLSYYDFWEADLWIGKKYANLPLKGDGSPDTSDFLHGTNQLNGTGSWEVSIPYVSSDYCGDGVDEYTLLLSAHAIVGENNNPPNGFYVNGTDHEAFAASDDSGNDHTVDIRIQCMCSSPNMEESVNKTETSKKASSTEPICKSAWGFYATSPNCFSDFDEDYPYGWTNGPVSFYNGNVTMDLVLQVTDNCEIGTTVGQITFIYDGNKIVEAIYELDEDQPDLYMTDTHLYIGEVPLFHDGTTNVTDPFDLPLLNLELGKVREDIHWVRGCHDENYVVAYAKVCGILEVSTDLRRRELRLPRSPKLRGALYHSAFSLS